MSHSPDVLETWQAAVAARLHAHAPYSEYLVGAALRLRNPDRIVSGCNVENASYGATICAERNAVWSAVAAHGAPLDAEHMVLVTLAPAPPCGMCLQVLTEFFPGSFPVYFSTPEALGDCYRLDQLLPNAFRADQLP
jgi:cytidine deaminase